MCLSIIIIKVIFGSYIVNLKFYLPEKQCDVKILLLCLLKCSNRLSHFLLRSILHLPSNLPSVTTQKLMRRFSSHLWEVVTYVNRQTGFLPEKAPDSSHFWKVI